MTKQVPSSHTNIYVFLQDETCIVILICAHTHGDGKSENCRPIILNVMPHTRNGLLKNGKEILEWKPMGSK
jgi:hypothetical protein